MANITLNFTFPLNDSLQIGDTVYYLNTTAETITDGGYVLDQATGVFSENLSGNPTQAHGSQSDIIEIGKAVEITATSIKCVIPASTDRPSNGSSFILFSKDNRANMSTLAGYYAEAKFENNSTEFAELYSVGSEIVESSK